MVCFCHVERCATRETAGHKKSQQQQTSSSGADNGRKMSKELVLHVAGSDVRGMSSQPCRFWPNSSAIQNTPNKSHGRLTFGAVYLPECRVRGAAPTGRLRVRAIHWVISEGAVHAFPSDWGQTRGRELLSHGPDGLASKDNQLARNAQNENSKCRLDY